MKCVCCWTYSIYYLVAMIVAPFVGHHNMAQELNNYHIDLYYSAEKWKMLKIQTRHASTLTFCGGFASCLLLKNKKEKKGEGIFFVLCSITGVIAVKCNCCARREAVCLNLDRDCEKISLQSYVFFYFISRIY